MKEQDIVKVFIEKYNLCENFRGREKNYRERVQIINEALMDLIKIIEKNRLEELESYYVYNMILIGEIYAKKLKSISIKGVINPNVIRLYELLAVIKELGIEKEKLISRK